MPLAISIPLFAAGGDASVAVPASRRLHAQFEALGGALLDDIAPAEVDPAALNRALSALDDDAPAADIRPVRKHPAMPDGFALARRRSPASTFIPGGGSRRAFRSARIDLPERGASRAFLLEIGAGITVPRHGHEGDEATCVLRGALLRRRRAFSAPAIWRRSTRASFTTS